MWVRKRYSSSDDGSLARKLSRMAWALSAPKAREYSLK
jgi:hypothetical protein